MPPELKLQYVKMWGRLIVVIHWVRGTVYLDPINGEVMTARGQVYARYDNETKLFMLMLNNANVPIGDDLQQLFLDKWAQAKQEMGGNSN